MPHDHAPSQGRRRQWRIRIVAYGGAALVHLALLGVFIHDWARHRAPARQDPMVVTLERPFRPDEPPRPSTPPPPVRTAPPTARVVAPTGETFVFEARPATPGSAPAPAAVPGLPARAEGPLDLGCLTPGLKGKAKEDCERKSYSAAMAPATKTDKRKYAVLDPDAPRDTGVKPGWRGGTGGLGLALSYVYGPNDKHFLPFQGDTKTTVFEPAEIHSLPPPMK